MEKKIIACWAFLGLLFLNAVHGEKWKENAVVKQCQEEVPLGGCDDKKCFTGCQQQFETTQQAFCLPDGGTCNCYYTCDNGNVGDCYDEIEVEGCDESKCYGACLDKVQGAVSGTCLPGNHVCHCYIPC